MNDNRQGKIITFYSYKGGTGRSMSLANVAWILASNEKKVLILDWDLEAPGLHRYFYPFLIDKELIASDGLIDFVWEFAVEAATRAKTGQREDSEWYKPLAELQRNAITLEHDFGEGTLDFIPAGRQGPSYSTRVNSFNWQEFYDKLGGGELLEESKRLLRQEYDYILIDSRTGVSDTAGICTVQMPDSLVICFTLNNQSIDGASAVAESVFRQRSETGIRIFPVPTRIENAEKQKREQRLSYAQLRFGRFPNHNTDTEWRNNYWREVSVNYISFYAYEEILAPFGDTPDSSLTLLGPAEHLASYLTQQGVSHLDWRSVRQRGLVLDSYAEQIKTYTAPEVEQIKLAEQVFSEMPIELQSVGRRALVRMVQLSPSEHGDRGMPGRVSLADLDSAGGEVLRRFCKAGLVVIERQETGAEEARFVNAALVQGWSRLQGWIEQDSDFLQWRQGLQLALEEWKRNRQSHDKLLSGFDLPGARLWLARRAADLNETEQQFIRASVELQERQQNEIAGKVFDDLSPREQKAARRLLLRMVRVARLTAGLESSLAPAEQEDTPASVALSELDPEAREILQTLRASGLVTVTSDPDLNEEAAGFVNESILTGWDSLHTWIEQDRSLLLWRQEMRAAFAEWRRGQRDESKLLRGEALSTAEAWLKERASDLSQVEQEYIKASLDLSEREAIRNAERAFSLLTQKQQESVSRVLVQMGRQLAADGDEAGERHGLDISDLDVPAREAVEALAGAGVFNVTRDGQGVGRVQFAYESLSYRWATLRDLLLEDREFQSWRQRMRGQIDVWEKGGHDKAFLLNDLSRADAEALLAKHGTDLSPDEQGFIRASLEWQERMLSQTAEALFVALSEEQQNAARRTLTRMIKPASADGKGAFIVSSLSANELSPQVREILNKFADNKIISIRREPNTNKETLAFAHESLPGHWPRFKEWLDEDRDFWVWRRQFHAVLEKWEQHGRQPDLLLSGEQYETAKRWRRRRPQELNESEIIYMEASREFTRRRMELRRRRFATALILMLATAFFAGSAFFYYRRVKVEREATETARREQKAAEYNSYGFALVSKKNVTKTDLDTAIDFYTRALSAKPDYADASLNRGNAYLRTGNSDGAVADFSEAIRLDPGKAESYNDRGMAFAQKGNLDRAIDDFNQAVKFRQDYFDAYLNLGQAYLAKGDRDRAASAFEAAYKVAPDKQTQQIAEQKSKELSGDQPAPAGRYADAKVFIYYNGDNSTVAVDIADRLKRRGFGVSGPPERNDGKTAGDIRYYYDADRDYAEYVQQIVQYGLNLRGIKMNIQLMPLLDQGVAPGAIEVWLPEELPNKPQSASGEATPPHANR